MSTATKVAVMMSAAAALIVMGWLVQSTQSAHERLATMNQPQATPEVVAADERVEDRVIRLPEDGGAFHTSVFVHANWRARQQDRELLAWFGSNPRLLSLREQTHYHVYTTRAPLFKTRYSKTIRVLPCVRVQSGDGKVVYQSSLDKIPGTPSGLADDISSELSRWPFRPCPRPGPQPEPEPKPEPDVDVDVVVTPVIPDVTPDTSGPEFPWALLVLVVLLAGTVPVVVHFKRAFK